MNKYILLIASLVFAASAQATPVQVPDSGNTAILGLGALCAVVAIRKVFKK